MASTVAVLSSGSVVSELLGKPAAVYVGEVSMTLEQALTGAEYLMLCFSASYCPSCKKFMPDLEYAVAHGGLESEKKCKVLLIGGDRTEEAFDLYRAKYPQFLSLSFGDTAEVKARLRDAWKISTIPHVALLEVQSGSVLHKNVRFLIEQNPRCENFPWPAEAGEERLHHVTIPVAGEVDAPPEHWTLWARISKKPRCLQLGHIAKAGSTHMYMDENAVRARAGLLNITSWIAMVNIFFWKEMTLLWILWPIVSWDMLSAALFGLTPIAPYGMAGTLLAYAFGPAEPHWKPAQQKRFAWVIGFLLVNTCFLGAVLEVRALMIVAVLMCNAATWAESALGFCVGCWMWNTVIAPRMGKQACQECKL